MDLGTTIGFVAIIIILLVAMSLGVGVGPYVDIPSLLITGCGSVAALAIAFTPGQMKQFGPTFLKAFKPPHYDVPELIKKLVTYATQARRDGILSLEQMVNQEENDFLRKGLGMAIDGSEPDAIRAIMETDSSQTLDRNKGLADIFETWAALGGAYGMVGTLIGLVAMLMNMSDPASIGPAMAVALITTLYGALIGNLLGSPIAKILVIRANEEALVQSLIIDGIMSIQSGDNPRILETKLLAFLPPASRISQFN